MLGFSQCLVNLDHLWNIEMGVGSKKIDVDSSMMFHLPKLLSSACFY